MCSPHRDHRNGPRVVARCSQLGGCNSQGLVCHSTVSVSLQPGIKSRVRHIQSFGVHHGDFGAVRRGNSNPQGTHHSSRLSALVAKSGKHASDPLWQAIRQLAELAKQHHNGIRIIIDSNRSGGAGAMISKNDVKLNELVAKPATTACGTLPLQRRMALLGNQSNDR